MADRQPRTQSADGLKAVNSSHESGKAMTFASHFTLHKTFIPLKTFLRNRTYKKRRYYEYRRCMP